MKKWMTCIVATAATLVAWITAPVEGAAVIPVLRSVYDPGDGGPLKALWGYESLNSTSVSIPVGASNFFTPAPSFRGQPTVFASGIVYAAFVTDLTNDQTIQWHLQGPGAGSYTATATPQVTTGTDPSHLLGLGTIVPFVHRTWIDDAGDKWAEFGYANGEEHAVALPVGANNYFSQPPAARGQTTNFLSGLVEAAFIVKFNNTERLDWRVNYEGVERVATAYAPVPEPTTLAVFALAGGLLLRRERRTQG